MKEHLKQTAKLFRVCLYSNKKYYVERFWNNKWRKYWGYGMKDKNEALALLNRSIKWANPDKPVRLEVTYQYTG